MKNVLVIGGATMDTIIEYEEMESLVHRSKSREQAYLLLEEGKKIEVKAQRYYSGGGATNTAVSFLRQGFNVQVVCKIGRDLMGEQVIADLRHFGLCTDHVSYCEEVGTASSFIVPALSGDRTVFAYRGANTEMTLADIPALAIHQADFIYVTSLSHNAAKLLPELVALASKAKVPVAMNPGISQLRVGSGFLRSALPNIDVLIMNYEEARELMASLLQINHGLQGSVAEDTSQKLSGSKLFDSVINIQDVRLSLKQFFQQILCAGPKTVVVTNGSEGVYVATPEQLYFYDVPSVHVVNTLGAGDAFGSSFVGMYYQGGSIIEAILAGVANSASVIQYPDAKTGLLEKSALKKAMLALTKERLQKYTWEKAPC